MKNRMIYQWAYVIISISYDPFLIDILSKVFLGHLGMIRWIVFYKQVGGILESK